MIPTSLEGLDAALRNLGFSGSTIGVDISDPEARVLCKDHVTWLFEQGPQHSQDRKRMEAALSMIDRFEWPGEKSVSAHCGEDPCTGGWYIPRDRNKSLTYYGPFESEDTAWVTEALTGPDVDLSTAESCDNSVGVRYLERGELAYYEDNPEQLGFRAVKVGNPNRIPIDSFLVRSPQYRCQSLSCSEVDELVAKIATKEKFFEWLKGEGSAKVYASSRKTSLVDEVWRLVALLEEEQGLTPLDFSMTSEGDVLIPEWEEDQADEVDDDI